MRKIAVFDTNILLSGIGWKGKPFLCLELARTGVVEGVTCRELLDELTEKLQSKLSLPPEQAIDTVADFSHFFESFPSPVNSRQSPLTQPTTRFWNAR